MCFLREKAFFSRFFPSSPYVFVEQYYFVRDDVCYLGRCIIWHHLLMVITSCCKGARKYAAWKACLPKGVLGIRGVALP